MYTIYADGNILHNPMFDAEGLIVSNPILKERLNTHGSLTFSVPPTNPLYGSLSVRNTKVKVVSDTRGNHPWFGRIMEISRGWNNCLNVYCEGELGCLNDSTSAPIGFKGAPSALLNRLITNYNGSHTNGYVFALGNVSVVDPNNLIVRSSSRPETIWNLMDDKLFGSSLGGYILPRYDQTTDTHYIDYLRLTEDDPYAVISSQEIEFGKNLLDFVQTVSAEDVITVLVPYGAQFDPTDTDNYEAGPPENGVWNGNRLTIKTVNNNRNYIENATGIDLWGRVVGANIWDDVTIAQNLKDKAEVWLANKIAQSLTLEMSAIDLSFADIDIEQIQVGQFVRCKSKPHALNVLMLCTEKTTYLTQLEDSRIVLGGGIKTMSDLYNGGALNES